MGFRRGGRGRRPPCRPRPRRSTRPRSDGRRRRGPRHTIGGAYARWERANVVRGVAKGTVSAYAWCRLGDVTAEQFHGLATLQRQLGAEVRVTNRQNVVFRNLAEDQLPALYPGLGALGMAEPGAELARDVVSCPGADTCNLAVTQSRGLAAEIGRALEDAGLAEVAGFGSTSPAAPTPAASTTWPTSGSSGSSAGPTAGPPPATSCSWAAISATPPSSSAARPGASRPGPPRAVVRIVGRFAAERTAGETFPAGWTGSAAPPPWPRAWPAWPPSPHRWGGPRLLRGLRRDGALRRRVGVGECAGSSGANRRQTRERHLRAVPSCSWGA